MLRTLLSAGNATGPADAHPHEGGFAGALHNG
jgi:hypothetical protein